jgi:hypothetical protein
MSVNHYHKGQKSRRGVHSKEEALFACLEGAANADPAAAANNIMLFSLISGALIEGWK